MKVRADADVRINTANVTNITEVLHKLEISLNIFYHHTFLLLPLPLLNTLTYSTVPCIMEFHRQQHWEHQGQPSLPGGAGEGRDRCKAEGHSGRRPGVGPSGCRPCTGGWRSGCRRSTEPEGTWV